MKALILGIWLCISAAAVSADPGGVPTAASETETVTVKHGGAPVPLVGMAMRNSWRSISESDPSTCTAIA